MDGPPPKMSAIRCDLSKVFCYSELISGKLDNLIGQLTRLDSARRSSVSANNNLLLYGRSGPSCLSEGDVRS